MINAMELMLHNVVKVDGEFIRITSFSEEGIELINVVENGVIVDSVPSIKIEDVNPIPLTPELLVKCGFEKVEIDAYSDLFKRTTKDFMFSVIYNYIQDKATFNTPHFTQFIQHLHQLQNLYFSLTGEELQINL